MKQFPAAGNLTANFSASIEAISKFCPKSADLFPTPGKLAVNYGNFLLKSIYS